MEITPHVAAVRSRLEAVVGDDDASVAVAERISLALDAALQLQLLDILSQAALEVTEQLPSGRVELRLAGRDAQLVFSDDVAQSSVSDDDSATARLTLRMSESLKAAVERAADAESASTNAWLVTAIKRSLDKKPSRSRAGNRLSGYAKG
jgi:predicted HicB family RNase H-like nuclease